MTLLVTGATGFVMSVLARQWLELNIENLDSEAGTPGRIIEVNVMGTVAALDWARSQAQLRRFIYVSSGSDYKSHGPDRPGEPLPEDGCVMPRRLVVAPPGEADIVQDDTERDGMWGAYDLARNHRDTGRTPQPVRGAFHAYIDWLAAVRGRGGH
jgi:hypothetical protein